MSLEQGIELFIKYLPVAIAIIKRESPTISAFITDFKAIQAGQAPTAVLPPAALISTTQFPPA